MLDIRPFQDRLKLVDTRGWTAMVISSSELKQLTDEIELLREQIFNNEEFIMVQSVRMDVNRLRHQMDVAYHILQNREGPKRAQWRNLLKTCINEYRNIKMYDDYGKIPEDYIAVAHSE
jgi:hypothetical protein